MRTRKHAGIFASLAALSLVVAACGGKSDGAKTAEDSKASGTATATMSEATMSSDSSASESAMSATATATATGDSEMSASASDTAPATPKMKITYTLSDAAVWSDGSPITVDDIKCSWEANAFTTGSISTTGYDQIISVDPGASDKEVVVTLKSIFAPWKGLFKPGNIYQASKYDDCKDLSQAFPAEAYNNSAGPYIMTEWTAEQIVYTKNAGYKGKDTGGPAKVVFVPAEDGITALKAGKVDFINPQSYTGIDQELADPNIKFKAEPSTSYEALYFMLDPECTPDESRSCAFADPVYREAFFKSIDNAAFFKQIYEPFAQGLPQLTCGPIAPGDYCDENAFKDTYDPEGAAKLLTDAGWKQGADGMWANAKGEVPEVHWMVNTGNQRRESAQSFMIPLMAKAGFKIKADNCEATPCVFQTRLPAEKYDLAMYINTVSPDPGYIASSYVCDQIPSEANDFQGQNNIGWCNKEADALLKASDQELDDAKRADQIKQAIALMRKDTTMLPLLQFPSVGAWRTDRVSGMDNNLANYWGFNDWWNFKDIDGDGQVVIGAEQFPTPDCSNPITECANSTWFVWLAGFPSFPGLYTTTNDQKFVPSEFLAGEAKVEQL